MNTRSTLPRRTWSNDGARAVMAAFSLLVGIIGLASILESGTPGGQRFGVGLLACAAWGAWRGYLSATVILGDETVMTRSMFRTRTYKLADIASVEVESGRTGPSGFGRQYLSFHFADGSVRDFKEFSTTPSKAPVRSDVESAAAEINGRRSRLV